MAKDKLYEVIIAHPARIRYQENILPYLLEYFSLERAIEIDKNILNVASKLRKSPARGSSEKFLEKLKEDFKYILYRETKHFEIKIIYYIDESKNTVYITDFFPTKMNPQKISDYKNP